MMLIWVRAVLSEFFSPVHFILLKTQAKVLAISFSHFVLFLDVFSPIMVLFYKLVGFLGQSILCMGMVTVTAVPFLARWKCVTPYGAP